MPTLEKLAHLYLVLWQAMKIKDGWLKRVKECANKSVNNKTRYEEVARKTGCPWFVIACIHSLESDFDFKTHLHNGDPLTNRTVHVPAGRPIKGKPPFTWEESAVDAILLEGVDVFKTGSLPEILYFLEGYNGWGYQNGEGRNTDPPKRSPYLWSGTNQYNRGKYIEDSEFSPDAISDQVGAAAILKELCARGSITFPDNNKERKGMKLAMGPIRIIRPDLKHPVIELISRLKNAIVHGGEIPFIDIINLCPTIPDDVKQFMIQRGALQIIKGGEFVNTGESKTFPEGIISVDIPINVAGKAYLLSKSIVIKFTPLKTISILHAQDEPRELYQIILEESRVFIDWTLEDNFDMEILLDNPKKNRKK